MGSKYWSPDGVSIFWDLRRALGRGAGEFGNR